MTASNPNELRFLLRSALDALKRGDRNVARALAEQAASLAPGSEEPWLVLAALSNPKASLAYIKKALQINPESQPALQALEWALKRLDDQSADSEDDLYVIGPLLSARLAVLAEAVLAPDPPPELIHPAASPYISAEALPESEPPSEPVKSPASPADPIPAPARPLGQAGSIHQAPGSTNPAVRPSPAFRPSHPATRKKSSLSPARILVQSLLGLGALASVCFLALWLGRPLLGRLPQTVQPPPQATALPVLPVVPTPDCSPPTLALATTTFQVQSLSPAPDGSLPAPAAEPGIAYWLQGTDPNYVFVLSPLPETLALVNGLPEGASATATWANCNSVTFTLSAPQPGTLDPALLPDQSRDNILIFVQTDPSGSGLVLRGGLTEEVISVLNTPMPDESGVLAEIGLMDTVASPDGNAVQLTVSIYNFGETSFTLTDSDISLTPPGGAPLEMTRSDPRLPEKVAPAETKTFIFTFPRPTSPTATLRIFTVEYDVEGY